MYGHSLISLTLILLSSLTLFACTGKIEQSEFEVETTKRWAAATQISWISEHYKQDQSILTPKSTWQAIMKVDFVDQQFSVVSDCVFYYVPSGGNDGVLKVVANSTNAPCSELIAEKGYSSIKKIVNFGYIYNSDSKSDNNLILKVDTKRISYNFLNMINLEHLQKKEKLAPSVKNKKNIHATITSVVNYNISSGLLKVGEICFDINDDCTTKVQDMCDQCEFASYQVIASQCQKKFRKVCGMDRCGLQGEPACLRGYLSSGIFPENYCINDSPLGICQKGLRVVCINATLMCE